MIVTLEKSWDSELTMIQEIQNNLGQKVYKYKVLEPEEQYKLFVTLSKIFDEYIDSQEISKEKICVDKRLINEVFVRVDKRKDYFIIFHDETYMNEIREAALLAYWIIKFKPFNISSKEAVDFKVNINCGFAAYIIFSAVREYCLRVANIKVEFSSEYINKFLYALKFWDLSKEAIMLVAETLCESKVNTRQETK